MKIAVLGTGIVGRAHAAKLASLGHEIVIGTRDPKETMNQTKPDFMGNPPFPEWQKKNSKVKLGTFAEAADHGEIIIEAIKGDAVIATLKSIEGKIGSKILIDISNPLDFSKGMPPQLFVSNNDSLAEQIQKTLPKAKVVKALNTLNAILQTNPSSLVNGEHHTFICGNDEQAKEKTKEILGWYGWKKEYIVDLGDIKNARGAEMIMPLWSELFGIFKTPNFNFRIVKRA